MELCARSERCSFDCRQSLWRWGVDPSEHDGVIKKLIDEKFIDDIRYTFAYVREKSNINRWGNHKIKAGLRVKRIPEDIISQALEQIDAGNENDILKSRLKKKLPNVKYSTPYDLRAKLLRYGVGQGFDYQQVADEIERLLAENRSFIEPDER